MALSIAYAERLVGDKKLLEAKAICRQLKGAGNNTLRVEFLLGSIALLEGNFVTALEVFAPLAKKYPQHAGVLNNLATAIQHTGGSVEDIECLIERSLELDPKNIPALINLGELQLGRKHIDRAAGIYQQILDIQPNHPQGYFGQAMCALAKFDYPSAYDLLKQAYKIQPSHPAIAANLMLATTQAKHHEEAITLARSIVKDPALHTQIGTAWAVLKRYCLWDEADELLNTVVKRLLSTDADSREFSPIALEILSCDGIDLATIKALHINCGNGLRRYSQIYAQPEKKHAFVPADRMRIGYLSGDFRSHVAAMFIKGLVNHHDSSRFEIFLYSSAPVSAQDELTGAFFRTAEHFVHCHQLDDGQLASRIADDGIHILIDLSGFTSHTRLSVLPLKPAPLQVTYIGYPGTYGLKEVDYILCNKDLVGVHHNYAFVEQPLILPNLYAILQNPANISRAARLPFSINGFVTFGSLINPYKINRSTIALWARVLNGVAGSRIYLNHPAYKCVSTIKSIKAAFANEGIAAERITVTDERPPKEGSHFLLYDKVDIVLDATPMTGGAGTTDALAVGVPVITRIGQVFHERLSAAAIRSNTPEPEQFIGETDDDFVTKAIKLGQQPERLASLRESIRTLFLTGPNSRTEEFTRELESTFITAWDTKFPQQPIDSLVRWQAETSDIPLSDNLTLSLPTARNNLYRFSASERGAWFEPECAFLANKAKQFGNIWDISNDPGLAMLPIAARLSPCDHLHCVRPDEGSRKLLARNLGKNALTDNVTLHSNLSSLEGTPALLRISAEYNDGQGSLVDACLKFTGHSIPIVLCALDGANGTDRTSANILETAGYRPFVLHPGCQVLTPLGKEQGQRNLFYVLPAATNLLAEHDILVEQIDPPAELPKANHLEHPELFRPATTSKKLSWSDIYISVLNAYAASRDECLSAKHRLACHAFAASSLKTLLFSEANIPRLWTAIRLAEEAGQRDQVSSLARQVAQLLENHHGLVFEEPYLMPLAEMESFPLQPNEDEAVWAQTMSVAALELSRSWSSLFTASESLLVWKQLAEYPWLASEAERRLTLLRGLWGDTAQPAQKK